MLTLIKILEKKNNSYNIKLTSGYIMKYIFIIYIFNVIDVNTI
jgi:hypothetical protein